MQVKDLQMKRALRTALLVLLLSVVGMGKMYAQSFTVGELNYSVNSDGISVTVSGHVDGTAATGPITIPETVTHEGIDYSVTTIGSAAFANCSSLTGNLVIPNSVTSIGANAFAYCTGFTGNLIIGNSVVSINSYAFNSCRGFTGSLTIGNSVTTIGYGAFSGCNGFTGILTIGNSVTSIGNSAFVNCWGFTGDLTIGNSVISIGNSAFTNCSSLSSIEISNSVTYIGNSAFSGCNGLAQIVVEEGNVVYDSRDNCNAIIKTINNELLLGCKNTIIPNSVTSIGDHAFSGCIGLTGDLAIPNSVITIGNYAFSGCSGLTGDLAIPNSVITIGSYAFSNCSGLTGDLAIPNSVTTIDSYAFSGCSGFTGSLTIGNSVTTLGNSAFSSCSGFETIFVVEGNTVYDSRENCNAIIKTSTNELLLGCKNTIIPNSVATIGDSAFSGCSGFTGALVIPNSVTMIGNSAFYGCSGITGDLVIPNSVTTIGSYAFSSCYHLTGNLTIGNSVTSIGNNAFSSCMFSSMTSLAETPPTLGYNTFGYSYGYLSFSVYVPCGCEDAYASLSWGGFNDFVGLCGGIVTVLANPEEGGIVTGGGIYEANQTCTVTATPNEGYIFINWTQNGTVVSTDFEYSFYLSDDVTLIANFVLEGNIIFADTNVKDICVSHWDTNGDGELSYIEAASVTNLGNYFQGNTEITSFDELQYFIMLFQIGFREFQNCSGLTSMVLPYSVTIINSYAFSGCTGLTGNLTIPNLVTWIGYSAFENCVGFTGNLTIPNSVTYIGDFAFRGCSGFNGGLTIGNSLTSIRMGTFAGCNGFTGVLIIPNSVLTIEGGWSNGAFESCSGFTSLVLGDSLTTIGERAFYYCTGFTSNLAIPNSVTTIGNGAFQNCSGFTGGLAIHDSVTTIGNSAFSGCSGFTGSLTIGNSLTSIGDYAFRNCSGFTGSLTIGNSVTSIGESAFSGCSGFTGNLTIPNSVTTIGGSAFLGCTGFTGSLTLSNSVTSIGSRAFQNCNGLTGSLTIGNSVTTIGDYAFTNYEGFSSFISLAETPPVLGNYVFAYNTNKPIYVPCGFEELYSSISWGGFNGFIGLCDYSVVVSADPEEGGTVTGGGVFEVGQMCTVMATANDGYFFVDWTLDETRISTEPEYAFSVTSDIALVAHFLQDGIIVFNDAVVKSICIAHWDTNGDGELSYAEAASVTDLGDYFQGNSQITSFDELQYFIGLSSIGSSAFYNCSGLASIILPNSVTTIDNYAFSGCSGFTGSLTIPNTVTMIGSYAFYNCTGFNGTLTLGESLETIGHSAFTARANDAVVGLNFIGNLTIPNSVTSIGFEAFLGCRGFTGSLTIGNSVTSIGNSAFSGCSGFTGNLIIPNSVTYLGRWAFSMCSGFTGGLTLGNSLTTISYAAFFYCSGLTGDLVIPNSVTSIDDMAFYGCSSFTGDLIIPNSVTTIGESAFVECSGFTGNLIIPSSVTEIGTNPFVNCIGIEQIMVDINNPTYDSRENCNAIIETSTNKLISGCKNSVILDGVATIGYSAFNGCSGMMGNLTIPNSVTSISSYAFRGCSGLTGNLVIPNSVTTIGECAFVGCSGFTGDLSIPNSVTAIGRSAFAGCSSFTGALSISNSITTIESCVFEGCSGLTGSLTIPNSVTTIGSNAFYNCTGFDGTLTLGNSLETIGYNAFTADGYTFGIPIFIGLNFTGDLVIPNTVTSIGDGAFYGCRNFTEVIMFNPNPPSLGSSAFLYTFFPVYVPYESLNDYKTATNWSNYENRIFSMAYKTISGYGEDEGKYCFVASPLVENTAPTAVDNLITETEYDLYRFNQSEELEWENYEANTEDFILENGQGYLYANAEETNIIFKGTFNEDETKDVELAYEANAEFAGWNLVGNPFPVCAYANRSYYTMNEEGTAIEPVAVSMETSIPACTGVMVKANNMGETATFSKTAPEAAGNQGVLQIDVVQANQRGALKGSSTVDKAIVSFNAKDALEKFVFGNGNAKIYIPQGGKDYAIACPGNEKEMPLNFKAEKNGQYTLLVNPESAEMGYLRLIDNLTGANIDLLATPSYTFEAKTTDYASRFRLVFSANGEDGPSTGSGNFAYVCNGEIIIVGDAGDAGTASLQVVDVLGHICRDVMIASPDHRVSTSGMAPGVYMLRLVNGEKVRTQKIVVQ